MSLYKDNLKNAFFMSFFSAIFISITVFVHDITQDKISYQIEKEEQLLLEQVTPVKKINTFEKKLFYVKNKLLGDVKNHRLWILSKKKTETIAIVESTVPNGYSGPIYMLVSAYLNGKIIGVRVLSHKETPGIGDKIDISISNWITNFSDMYVSSSNKEEFLIKKYGGKIEQFTGATITPQAVSNSVYKTVLFIKNIKKLNIFMNKNSI